KTLQQSLTIDGFGMIVLKDPRRSLVVPHQRVTNNEHPMLAAECDVAIGGVEIVFVRSRMNQRPLQNVLRRNGVELRDDQGNDSWVLFVDFAAIERCSD